MFKWIKNKKNKSVITKKPRQNKRAKKVTNEQKFKNIQKL